MAGQVIRYVELMYVYIQATLHNFNCLHTHGTSFKHNVHLPFILGKG